MNAYLTRQEERNLMAALAELNRLINDEGFEYPDAQFMVSHTYDVSYEVLQELYDKQDG